jgi:hypothetical protein
VAAYDARAKGRAYGAAVVKRSYAVVWSNGHGVDSGRLEPRGDRFELVGRDHARSVGFGDIVGLSIARQNGERLRGLPVLVLRLTAGDEVRVASLEGTAVLHDLVDLVEQG